MRAQTRTLAELFPTPHRWPGLRALHGILLLAAALWFASAAAKLAWQQITPANEPKQNSAELGPAAILPQAPAIALAQFHLFGASAEAAALAAQNAPATQLKLTLMGVAAGRDPKTGVAIIADEQQRQREYQSGDSVAGAVVDEIYSDRVVLIYQGRPETLYLPKLSKAIENQSLAIVPQTGAPNFGLPGASLPTSDPSNGYVNPTAGASTASFAAAREQALANPAGLIGMVQPVMDANGQLSGIKLNGGANQALLTQAGLLPDDVVVAVNGQRINSIEQGASIANQLADAEQVSVTVRRGGREVTLPSIRLR